MQEHWRWLSQGAPNQRSRTQFYILPRWWPKVLPSPSVQGENEPPIWLLYVSWVRGVKEDQMGLAAGKTKRTQDREFSYQLRLTVIVSPGLITLHQNCLVNCLFPLLGTKPVCLWRQSLGHFLFIILFSAQNRAPATDLDTPDVLPNKEESKLMVGRWSIKVSQVKKSQSTKVTWICTTGHSSKWSSLEGKVKQYRSVVTVYALESAQVWICQQFLSCDVGKLLRCFKS